MEKSLRKKNYLFLVGQSMKKIIMAEVGYFCMGQKMMWNNVINLSHILCQQVQLSKLYNYVESINLHNTCTKYIQSANIMCDEPIKKGFLPKNK